MDKKILAGLAAVFFFTGCAALESLEVREQKYGKAAPVIDQYFASPVLRPGDTWKVYLKASDPDGDMKTIVSHLDAGTARGERQVSFTRLHDGDRREFSGYLYWYPGFHVGPFSEFIMTIQVQDMAGRYSSPVSLTLSVRPSGRQEPPPQGVFRERDLGPVMIDLKPATGGGNGS